MSGWSNQNFQILYGHTDGRHMSGQHRKFREVFSQRHDDAGVVRKLGLKGIGGFSLSQGPQEQVIAAYVPEGKGIPGYVGLWRVSDLHKSPQSPPPFARRSFFKV